MKDFGTVNLGSTTGKGKGTLVVQTAGPRDLLMIATSLESDFDFVDVPLSLTKQGAQKLVTSLNEAIASLGD